MTWDVRPTKDLEEFKRAVGAIGHYFGGWPADDERRSGSRRTCRSSGCTPRSTATGSSAARARSRSS